MLHVKGRATERGGRVESVCVCVSFPLATTGSSGMRAEPGLVTERPDAPDMIILSRCVGNLHVLVAIRGGKPGPNCTVLPMFLNCIQPENNV